MLGEHEVRRLDVAVDDPAAMGRGESGGEVPGDTKGLGRVEGAAGEAPGERLALEQFHDEEGKTLVLADVEQGADVRVGEARHRPGLPLETLALEGVRRDQRVHELDGHLAVEPGVARTVDLAHPAGAERADDLVGAHPRPGGEFHAPGHSPTDGLASLAAVTRGAASHSPSFDQRRTARDPRTAIASAFFCPTSTTSFRPRVIPV